MANQNVSRERILILFIILLQISIIPRVNASYTNSEIELAYDTSHDLILDARGWVSISLHCYAGDDISGEFTLTNNGDLFIGDQTKYDNWLLDGVDFLILDAVNYELWKDNRPSSSLFEKKDVVELSWTIEIPSEGNWFIIYYNDSIFMKQIEGSIQHSSLWDLVFISMVVVLIGLATLLSTVLIFRKKK